MKIFNIIVSAIIFSIYTTSIFGQIQNITIYSGQVDEPSIMINPSNPDEIVAASNLNRIYYSNDGGYNWKTDITGSSYGVWGDPCLLVDNQGHFYFFHLSNPIDSGSWIDRIVCQKSNDGGLSWSNGSYAGKNGDKIQDKEWATIDRSSQTIYLSWTQFDVYADLFPNKLKPEDSTVILFSKSEDLGNSWSDPIRINDVAGDCFDDDNAVEGAVPMVGPNGEVYVCWAGPKGLVFDKSEDGGQSWLPQDQYLDSMPGGWNYTIPGIYRCNGLPIIACDTSRAKTRGNIYINWSDQRNGSDNTDIWLLRSTDGGNNWSERIKVNNDTGKHQQFFTWMTIDQSNGYIYIVFYDRRSYSDLNTDVYLAVSKNGGISFENYRISEEPFIPDSTLFFGDYTNITAHNNVIRPIWTRMHNGKKSIMTALIDSNSLTISESKSLVFTSQTPYPNPFHKTTSIAFKLYFQNHIQIDLFDSYGRHKSVLEDQVLIPGKYIYTIDAEALQLPSGPYYISIRSDQGYKTHPILLINGN